MCTGLQRESSDEENVPMSVRGVECEVKLENAPNVLLVCFKVTACPSFKFYFCLQTDHRLHWALETGMLTNVLTTSTTKKMLNITSRHKKIRYNNPNPLLAPSSWINVVQICMLESSSSRTGSCVRVAYLGNEPFGWSTFSPPPNKSWSTRVSRIDSEGFAFREVTGWTARLWETFLPRWIKFPCGFPGLWDRLCDFFPVLRDLCKTLNRAGEGENRKPSHHYSPGDAAYML